MEVTVLSQLLVVLSVSSTKIGLHNITWVVSPTYRANGVVHTPLLSAKDPMTERGTQHSAQIEND